MTSQERDELATMGLRVAEREIYFWCRRWRPRDDDGDLRSAANEVVCRALVEFDPAAGLSWAVYLRVRLRFAFRGVKRRAVLDRARPLTVRNGDGEEMPVPRDATAADPLEVAAARELVDGVRRFRDAVASGPDRRSMLADAGVGEITFEAARAVTREWVARARGGDVAAACAVAALVAAARGRTLVDTEARNG